MGPKIHLELGITVVLVIWMCEPLFYTIKYVVTDSGFCVANGIVALAEKLVYSGALIKNHRYGPKIVPGYIIGQYFSYNEVGDLDMLEAATEYVETFGTLC